jgi:c-di-GMP-binding flagellar brake protein YcgR
MNLAALERRSHPRTQAYVPITFRPTHLDEEIPAHLLDLSCAGAALAMTAGNAPDLGEFMYVRFETPTNDGASESLPREELALVVNIRRPERGIARIGVRFIHTIDAGNEGLRPQDLLSDQRTWKKTSGRSDRWSFLNGDVISKSKIGGISHLAGAAN